MRSVPSPGYDGGGSDQAHGLHRGLEAAGAVGHEAGVGSQEDGHEEGGRRILKEHSRQGCDPPERACHAEDAQYL